METTIVFRVQLRVKGLGFWGLGLGVKCLGFKVEGLWFEV